jgi:hypothetical protein
MLKKQNKNEFKLIDILEIVQIIYNDGKKDFFEAIQISNNGVFTGRIINNNFVDGGFIPKKSIKHIFKNGKKIFFKKNQKLVNFYH